jgi:copper(I)-binding protein
MKRFVWLCAGAIALSGALCADAHEAYLKDLKIVHPYTLEPAPGVVDVVVSMTIRNQGAIPDRLVGASSPLAARAEIHADGAAAPSGVDLPAGASVKFGVKGPHIMLLGLTEALTGYEMFPLWLTFEKAGRVEVEVMVEEGDDAMTGHPPESHPPDTKTAPDPHDNHGDHK